jgi:hypothetical protein
MRNTLHTRRNFKSTTRRGLRPAAVTCLPARGRRAKAAGPAAPRECALLGAGATPEGVDRIVSPMGSKRWKIVL